MLNTRHSILYTNLMIARLHGEVIEKDETGAIIDVGGMGYKVAMTENDLKQCQLNEPVTVYTYFHVRENSQELFGFREFEAKKLFELLIGVSGVGPKMAMSVLNLGDQRQLRQAVASGNVAYITAASGVGKRLAERLVVDLKDKVGVIAGEVIENLGEMTTSDDAVEALVALGYSQSQAISALAQTNPEDDVEERIKQALRKL